MTWSQKQIEELKSKGKIRGFHMHGKEKGFSAGKKQVRQAHGKSKGLEWLSWNLQYWCNEKALTLEREYKFCTDRDWRFDFALPSVKIAIEYEGGIYLQKSGHNTAKHYTKDTEKYNRATVLGWRVIRVTAMNYTTVLKTLNEMI